MAYPDDEQNGTVGAAGTFRSTNLADPNAANRQVASANGDVVNYLPTKPPIGATSAASREAQITALLPNITIPLPPNPNADARGFVSNVDATLNSNPNTSIANQYKEHKRSLDAANEYLNTSAHMHTMREEIGSKLDSADFLQELSKINHDSPTYEADAAKLFAKFPRAGGAGVQDALNIRQGARANYLHGMAGGGASEFADGSPERDAYEARYHLTKNPIEAKAHAENVQKGEEMIKTSIANGIFDVNDLSWAGGKPVKPEFFNPNGTVNYHAIGLAASKKAGELFGKSALADDKAQKEQFEAAKEIIAQHKGKTLQPDNPAYKSLKAAEAIVARQLRGNPPAATSVPAPAAPVAPAGPVKSASAYF